MPRSPLIAKLRSQSTRADGERAINRLLGRHLDSEAEASYLRVSALALLRPSEQKDVGCGSSWGESKMILVLGWTSLLFPSSLLMLQFWPPQTLKFHALL